MGYFVSLLLRTLKSVHRVSLRSGVTNQTPSLYPRFVSTALRSSGKHLYGLLFVHEELLGLGVCNLLDPDVGIKLVDP